VKGNGSDQNSGVVKLNALDGNTPERQEDCLKRCRATPGVTGCEVIWDQGNRGCYAHTKEVASGNGVGRHLCWIFSKCRSPRLDLECSAERGFCVKENGSDQNSGVVKLNALDGNTPQRQEDCLKRCLAIPGVNGCEVIWNQGNRGCYAHTREVARGNGVGRHLCWITSKCRKPKLDLQCSMEQGYCVRENGSDQNSGVVKINSLDGNRAERQEDCLKQCLATPGVTGCEVIWDQGNRGCYAHTSEVAYGNGVGRHGCWIVSKCGSKELEKSSNLKCPAELGFCVKGNGSDQNSGVVKLNALDGNTPERQEDCLKRCRATPGVTGCEVIWDQGNRGCYAHTKEVARGNGVGRHRCWIFSKCYEPTLDCPVETGYCVKNNGADQNTGVVKLNALDGNTVDRLGECMDVCLSTPGVTGCEVIWGQGNRGCYAHTEHVARGNGASRHLCWITDKCNERSKDRECTKQKGYCVKHNGKDQNSGVIKLNSLNGNTGKVQAECLELCLAIPGVTGCEVIWDQSNRGCYAHTEQVARGNGHSRHLCWICK